MHSLIFHVALLVSFAFLILPTARAQEVQVPLDEDGRLMVVDADLERRLGLFPEYERFREARLYRASDGSYVLVVQYDEAGTIVQDREAMTATEAAALRTRITEALAASNIRTGLDQEGRVSLLWTAAGMSLLAYGPSLVGVLDVEDEAAAGTIVLLAGAAGFFAPYYATQSIPVTRPAAALTRSGAIIGYAHGVALAVLLGGEGTGPRGVLAGGLAASLAEAFAGYHFATQTGISHGSVETMTTGSLFGAGLGLGAAALVLGDFEDDEVSARTLAGLGLAGSLAGTYAGYQLSRTEPYSRGDARVLSTAGVLGFLTGAALMEVADIRTARPASGLLIASTTAGLAAGHVLTRGREFSHSEGNFMALGAIAGGLVGAATSNLVDGSTAVDAVLTTVGSIAGFGIMYTGYREEAAARAARSVNLSLAPSCDPVLRSIRPGFRLQAQL